MTPLFLLCFPIVVGTEGLLSTDPTDKGNWSGGEVGSGTLIGTKYGVAAAYHPGVDIKNLSLPDAELIHFDEYWSPACCEATPLARAALCLYDCAVNQGVGTAVKLMQQAIGVPVDGAVGPQTLAAMHLMKPEHIARFMALRAVRYASTQGAATQEEGWMDRLFTISLTSLST